MEDIDLFVGNRFHGTVAAVLAGTPQVIIPFDARTRELTEYHHLTHLYSSEIKPETSIVDYLERLDFSSFEKNQHRNLCHYLDFLRKNRLDSIFEKSLSISKGESPMESKIGPPVTDIIHCAESLDVKEQGKREYIYKSERFVTRYT